MTTSVGKAARSSPRLLIPGLTSGTSTQSSRKKILIKLGYIINKHLGGIPGSPAPTPVHVQSMVTLTVNLSTLKRIKNVVIGNPTAKLTYARDEDFIVRLVDCINNPTPYLESSHDSPDDIRTEAAHVLSSLSYGSADALKSLLQANAHQAFLYAISNFRPSESNTLRAAFSRALRAISVAIAETVGPSQWGIGLQEHPEDVQSEARMALDFLFEIRALDIFLPLLEDPSPQVNTSIAQLLSSTVRTEQHRLSVSEWLPPHERNKEVKGKRGWEKAGPANSPARQGGWVVRRLVVLISRRDVKVQEAALSALASISRDNATVAAKLVGAPHDKLPVLSTILSLCKSRVIDLQLAACLCATSIIRAGISPYSFMADPTTPAMPIIHVTSALIGSATESVQTRTRACFILFQLVSDDKDLCQLAFERGSLSKLADAVKSITPSDATEGWDEDEPDSISNLREAAFTTISSLSLFDNDIRSTVTDTLHLIPYIQASLTHHNAGVRYAATQCVRALSRAVSVVRTNIMDTGLGMDVYHKVFCRDGEDRRVLFAASAVICNLLTECSPLRPTLVEQGVVDRLVRLLHTDEPELRLNALWAFKNLLYKSNTELKRKTMHTLEWSELITLMVDDDPGIQEQAFHVLRHIADDDEGIDMIFREMGADILLQSLSGALESENDDLLRQGVCVLANLANSQSHHLSILSNPRILSSLRACLVDSKVEIRRPAAACVLELIRSNPRSHREIREAGIESTLRNMYDFGGSGGMSRSLSGGSVTGGIAAAGSPTARLFHMGAEDDREVKEKVRDALHWLERHDIG